MPGHVVTRPYPKSNIGSNLASLAGAVWLARQLDRELIVDWRGLAQLHDPALNYFGEFLETPPEMLGVTVRYAPCEDVAYDDVVPTEPGEAHLIGTGQRPAPDGPIVLTTYHGPDRLHPGPEADRYAFLRSFYRCVNPDPRLRETIDDWWTRNLDGTFVVGVNVRTGNGRYFGKGMPYEGRVDVSIFDDRRRFLRMVERALTRCLRRLPPPLRASSKVFYASDSREMSELLARLPNAVTRRTVFPPPGTGDTYVFEGSEYSDRDSVVDTLADMFLLARCDALVYNSSMFNQYARILNANFGGNQTHLETLYVRWHARRKLQAVRRRLPATSTRPWRGLVARLSR